MSPGPAPLHRAERDEERAGEGEPEDCRDRLPQDKREAIGERGSEEGDRPEIGDPRPSSLLLGDEGQADQMAEEQRRADPERGRQVVGHAEGGGDIDEAPGRAP